MVALLPAGGAGYAQGLTVPGITPSGEQAAGRVTTTGYWPHSKLKRCYSEYLSDKRMEIEEQKESRRYRHGAHWTPEQIQVFNRRKQPVVTYNRISRKIDGVVGLMEKIKQDPKAFPRTPNHGPQADLATASLRCCLDEANWNDITPFVAATAAVDGIGGVELVLEQDRFGGQTIALEEVDIEGFFYDPRSKKSDFRDAAYMGCGKWVDLDIAKSMFPQHADKLDNAIDDTELTSSADSDIIWTQGTGEMKSVRLVYICYQHNNDWCYALFTGSDILQEGKTEFRDKNGRGICKYIMFSAAVDHDRDRYGFVRHLKSAQDEINQRRSKALHELNVRRIIAEKGAFDDIEEARREAARPDGVVERNKGFEAEFDDQKKAHDIAGHIKFLEDSKAEVENFGPNPALLGNAGISNRSGRAIALLQQAGIAELGPYVIAYKGWKLRVYRALFSAIQKYWTHERYIRVNDDYGQEQLLPVNQINTNEMGQRTIVNPLGQLDVDIVLDEGPDTVTLQQDFYETLQQIIPGVAPLLAPPLVNALVEQLLLVSPLDAQSKKKLAMAQQQAQQPNPMQVQAQQLELQDRGAKIEETKSKTVLNFAKAQSEGMPDQAGVQQPPEYQLPPEVQIAQAMGEIEKSRADTELKRAQAGKVQTDAMVAPMKQQLDERRAQIDERKAQDDSMLKAAQAHKTEREATILPMDLAQRAFDAAEDRKVAKMKPKPTGTQK